MQHPTSGRKFSIATGRYTDELPTTCDEAPATSAAEEILSARESSYSNPKPAVEPVSMLSDDLSGPRQRAPDSGASDKSDSDNWCEDMSKLMLQGWKMLNETCPVTEAVPLMGHPKSGRKFSVAVGKYVDEIYQTTSGQDEGKVHSTASSGSELAPSPPLPVRFQARSASSLTNSVQQASTVHSISSDIAPAPSVLPPVLASNIPPRPGSPARVAEVAPRLMASSSLEAIDSAGAALTKQLVACSAQLAASPSPPPPALVDAVRQCAEAMQAVEATRRALCV